MIAKQKKHALLSASSSERWLNCTPSARIESTYKDDITSPFAEEGTKAHELGECYILNKLGKTPDFTLNVKNKDAPLDMQGYAKDYADYVINIPSRLYISAEEELDLSYYIPEGFGTCDAFVITNDTLHIIDFKYGMGVKVSAYENTQLKIYALGVINKYKLFFKIPDQVVLHIYQPRISNINTYQITTNDLLKWGDEMLKTLAKVAITGSGEFNQGKWCKFCKHKNNCKARFDYFKNLLRRYQHD